jgi:hypothetical protein
MGDSWCRYRRRNCYQHPFYVMMGSMDPRQGRSGRWDCAQSVDSRGLLPSAMKKAKVYIPPSSSSLPPVPPKMTAASFTQLILVKPPPSSSSSPQNLQIQLLRSPIPTPSSYTAIATASLSSSSLPTGMRSRSSSVGSVTRSERSDRSAGGRRRVEPLYSLEVHSILPTVVTDAGEYS